MEGIKWSWCDNMVKNKQKEIDFCTAGNRCVAPCHEKLWMPEVLYGFKGLIQGMPLTEDRRRLEEVGYFFLRIMMFFSKCQHMAAHRILSHVDPWSGAAQLLCCSHCVSHFTLFVFPWLSWKQRNTPEIGASSICWCNPFEVKRAAWVNMKSCSNQVHEAVKWLRDQYMWMVFTQQFSCSNPGFKKGDAVSHKIATEIIVGTVENPTWEYACKQ